MDCFAPKATKATVTLIPITEQELSAFLKDRSDPAKSRDAAWVKSHGFKAKAQTFLALPSPKGTLDRVLVGMGAKPSSPDEDGAQQWLWGGLPGKLPAGRYALAAEAGPENLRAAAFGWALGSYAFRRYDTKTKAADRAKVQLVVADEAIRTDVTNAAEAIYLVRDLINTPASDMGPEELADAAQALARKHRAKFKSTVGPALLKNNYPMIHAVGRASHRAPRLIDFTWGNARAPKITLVGKGVCFDSGGLDIKPASAMLMMKKDMGGAAQVLGLAHMIMAAKLPVRLRVMIPAVENSIDGNAFRPMDILPTRKGITVEVGNTDAEGRLVLADAITEACSEKPKLLVDFATLTGAARVAVGTEIAAFFSNDDTLASQLQGASETVDDPVWRLPLHKSYRRLINSKIADISSTGSAPFAGATTAALFLEEFVDKGIPWMHFDIMAWNQSPRPGRPEGGEAMGVRAMFKLIADRFGR